MMGIGSEIKLLENAAMGADVIITWSAVFDGKDPEENLNVMKEIING